MDKKIKISIIMTSYNHAESLRESIDSVLNQTFPDFELIIWDDASIDDSWFIINSYIDPRIRAFRNPTNRGWQANINKAISEIAIGEYIAIHHSDDIWKPDKLHKQVDFLDTHPQYGAVFTNAQIIDENGKQFKDKSHFYYRIFNQPNRSRYEWLNFFFYKGNALCQPSVLIRKKCHDDCGLYRNGLNQIDDFDMWVRLCLKYEIHIIPEKLVRFRVLSNEMNASGNRPETRIRWPFEMLQVLDNYLKIPTYQELVNIFPAAQKYYRQDGCDIGFVISMVALETTNDNPIFCLFGLKLLFEAINDPDRQKRLNELYGFTHKDFVALTAKYDVFSIELKPYLYSQLSEKDQAVQLLTAQVVDMEQAVQSLSSEIVEREQTMQALQAKLVEKEEREHSLQSQLSKWEKEIKAVHIKNTELEHQIDGLTAQLDELKEQVSVISMEKTSMLQELTRLKDYLDQRERVLKDLNSKLLEIYSSTAWKIIQLMWKVRLWLAPKGSKREKFGHSVLGTFHKREPISSREKSGTPVVNLPGAKVVELDSRAVDLFSLEFKGDHENKPLVSVIIPCYNDGIFLNECLNSVFNQTFKSIEIIIINDGSTDEVTNNILNNPTWPFTKIINIKHSGPSSARNAGIKVSSGKYILPLDADDKIHPTYIEKAVTILEEEENIGIVYCQAEYFGSLEGRWELPPYSLEVMLLDNVIFTTALFRKIDWQNVNGYDESLSHGMEDYDFWLSIIETGKGVVQLPEVLFYYRIKDKSRTNRFNENIEQVQDTYLRIYRNHPRLFSRYQDEYSIRLRNALIELVFIKRQLEEAQRY